MTRPALLTLEDAAELLPAAMTVGTLRGLIRRGVLPKRKLGKRLWLTPDDLMRLTECPASASPRGSTSAPTPANTSFETAQLLGGQAAALASLNRLRQRSRDTLKAAPPRGEVVPLTRTS